MLEHIKTLLQQHPEQVGDLLHIGAGLGSELEEYQAMGFRHLHLYEADPSQYDLLKNKAELADNIHTYNRVIADKAETCTFYIMNNPSFNALYNPQQALADHFPNLSVKAERSIETESLTQAIKRVDLDPRKTNILVLETLDVDTLLSSVSEAQLQQVSWILTITPVGAHDMRALTNTLFDETFTKPLIFPFTLTAYKRNTKALELHETLTQLQKKFAVKEKEFSKVKEELLKNQQSLTERLNALESEKKSLAADVALKDKELKNAQQTLTVSAETFEAEKATIAAKLKVKNGALSNLRKELEQTKTILQEHTEALEVAKKDKQELLYRQTALDEEVTKAEAQLELIKDVVLREKAF